MRFVGANWVRLAVACCLWPARAEAHTPGLSTGTYAVRGSTVAVELTFERTDAAKLFRGVDVDGDLALSAGELARGKARLGDELPGRLLVRVDGKPCAPHLEDARPVEGDGVVIEATYACPDGALLGVLPAFFDPLGEGHQHLARVTGGYGIESHGIATRKNPTFSHRLTAPKQAKTASPARRLPLGLAAGALLAAAVAGGVTFARLRLQKRRSHRTPERR